MSFVTDALGLTGNDPVQVDPYRASDIYSTTGSAVGGPGGSVTTTLSPELQKFYDFYLQSAMANMPTAQSQDFANQVSQYGQGMFSNAANLNQQQMTSNYYNQVLAGLDPQRQQENVTLGNTLFSQGRTGAGAGVEGGYVNPEQFALLKAREQANAGIYLSAEDRARQIQQEKLQNSLGFVGLGNELKTQGYALPTSLFGTGVQLGQINNPLINPALAGGQYVTGVNQANATYQNQAMLGDQAFISGLISSAMGSTNPMGKFSSLFSSAPATSGGYSTGGYGGSMTSTAPSSGGLRLR